MSGGFGAPNSNNRKQDTLANRDQPELNEVQSNNSLVGTLAQQTMFKMGYMTKSNQN